MFGSALVIGRHDRVLIRVVEIDGKPAVHSLATSADAIGDVLGLIVDLDIPIPPRRAALDEIRRALEHAPLDPDIPKPARRAHSNVGCGDVIDCAGDAGDCFDVVDIASSCDVPSCDVPSCDLPCDVPDPGCF